MLGEDFELEFVDGTLWVDAPPARSSGSSSRPPRRRCWRCSRSWTPTAARRFTRPSSSCTRPTAKATGSAPPAATCSRSAPAGSRGYAPARARAARTGRCLRGARGLPRRDSGAATASSPTSTSATGSRRRSGATSTPGAARAVRAAAARLPRPRPAGAERVSTVGLEVGEWERTWDDDGYAAAIEARPRGDRARRRLPDEPRPAPVGAVRRRPAGRCARALRPLHPLPPRPLAGTAGRSCRRRPSSSSPGAATGSSRCRSRARAPPASTSRARRTPPST